MKPLSELIEYVRNRGYNTERVYNNQDQVAGLRLLGPRGNKGFVMIDDGHGDLDSVALWCDGVDYSSRHLAERRRRMAK